MTSIYVYKRLRLIKEYNLDRPDLKIKWEGRQDLLLLRMAIWVFSLRGVFCCASWTCTPLFEFSAQRLEVTSEKLLTIGHRSSWRKNNVNQSLRAAQIESSPCLILESATGKDLPPSPALLGTQSRRQSLFTPAFNQPSTPAVATTTNFMPRLFWRPVQSPRGTREERTKQYVELYTFLLLYLWNYYKQASRSGEYLPPTPRRPWSLNWDHHPTSAGNSAFTKS